MVLGGRCLDDERRIATLLRTTELHASPSVPATLQNASRPFTNRVIARLQSLICLMELPGKSNGEFEVAAFDRFGSRQTRDGLDRLGETRPAACLSDLRDAMRECDKPVERVRCSSSAIIYAWLRALDAANWYALLG